jgi:DNA repair protein RecN (Recombination protein N)
MLRKIAIHNFVLIDKLELDFSYGFSVLTGETGAGKSILLDALGLLTGDRADPGLIRPQADQAVLIAEFDISADKICKSLLDDHGIEHEGLLIIRRLLKRNGTSKAFLNDQTVTLTFLKSIGSQLLEITGQFSSSSLLQASQHLSFVDDYGVAPKLMSFVAANFHIWQNLKNQYESLLTTSQQIENKREHLQEWVKELEYMNPEAGEEEILRSQKSRIQNHQKILGAVEKALSSLANPQSIDQNFYSSARCLEKISDHDEEKFAPIIEQLNTLTHESREIIDNLQDLHYELSGEKLNLESVDDRLHALRDLARKHQVMCDDLPELLAKFHAELKELQGMDDQLAALSKELKAAQQAYIKGATELEEVRIKLAREFESDLLKELAPLKLNKARFEIKIDRLSEPQWRANGFNGAEFLASMNPGMPVANLKDIASGGELSRFLLALKLVLTKANHARTLIFDEIDTGVGGAVSEAIGERLQTLGKYAQTLSITHAPQVATHAATHYHVSKVHKNNTTTTTVRVLSQAEREEEIARMLSGTNVTDEARAAAQSLIKAKAS